FPVAVFYPARPYRTPASQLSMPLAVSPVVRTRLHTRRVTYEGFQRDDGLFDIEGHLTDVKDQDFALLTGLRAAGEAIHDMWVRVTVGRDYVIRAIEVKTDEMPYTGACDEITPAYSVLVGISLLHGYRKLIYVDINLVSCYLYLMYVLTLCTTDAV